SGCLVPHDDLAANTDTDTDEQGDESTQRLARGSAESVSATGNGGMRNNNARLRHAHRITAADQSRCQIKCFYHTISQINTLAISINDLNQAQSSNHENSRRSRKTRRTDSQKAIRGLCGQKLDGFGRIVTETT